MKGVAIMGFMIVFGWLYQALEAVGIDIAPLIIKLCSIFL